MLGQSRRPERGSPASGRLGNGARHPHPEASKGQNPNRGGRGAAGRAVPLAPPAAAGSSSGAGDGLSRTMSPACPAPACAGLPLPAWPSQGQRAGQGCRPRSALAARFAKQPACPFERGVKQLPVCGWETSLWLMPPWHSTGSSTGSPAAPKSGACPAGCPFPAGLLGSCSMVSTGGEEHRAVPVADAAGGGCAGWPSALARGELGVSPLGAAQVCLLARLGGWR